MAKKKSKKSGVKSNQKPISPEKYMREKSRALPLYKCYISKDWQDQGLAVVIVARRRPDDNIAYSFFLVDTFCLGVKNAGYKAKATPEEFEEFVENNENRLGLDEVSYPEAHNLIYGAIGFAEDAGIEPHRDFGIAGGILEEDTDDVPLIEYEFGKDGKYCLVVGPYDDGRRLMATLRRNLGDDFNFIAPPEGLLDDDDFDEVDDDYDFVDDEDDFDEGEDDDNPFGNFDFDTIKANFEKMQAEMARHPKEIYSYQRPEYPSELKLKHPFIGKELLAETNRKTLQKRVIDQTLALPADEAAADLSQVILYEIGRTWQAIEDETIGEYNESALVHAVILLTALKRPEGLEGIAELLRQSYDFMDYHFGDISGELLPAALYACAGDNVAAIEELLNQAGLDSFNRKYAFEALAYIIAHEPERRAEIIGVMSRKLQSMVDDLPAQHACDGSFAGLAMCDLINVHAHELIPEIRRVFDTDCVDKSIAGDVGSVVTDIEQNPGKIDESLYVIPDVYERFRWVGRF